MKKQYKYEKCEKFVQLQDRDAHLAKFRFLEITNDRSVEESIEITLEITNPVITAYKNNLRRTKGNEIGDDDRLIKVLCGIAIEDGLKKDINSIWVGSNNYPKGISKYEEYGMEGGELFTVEYAEPPFGFHSKHR